MSLPSVTVGRNASPLRCFTTKTSWKEIPPPTESSAARFRELMKGLVLLLVLPPLSPRLLSFLLRRAESAMFGCRRLRRSSVCGSG